MYFLNYFSRLDVCSEVISLPIYACNCWAVWKSRQLLKMHVSCLRLWQHALAANLMLPARYWNSPHLGTSFPSSLINLSPSPPPLLYPHLSLVIHILMHMTWFFQCQCALRETESLWRRVAKTRWPSCAPASQLAACSRTFCQDLLDKSEIILP